MRRKGGWEQGGGDEEEVTPLSLPFCIVLVFRNQAHVSQIFKK
jgi:hypothetical protein